MLWWSITDAVKHQWEGKSPTFKVEHTWIITLNQWSLHTCFTTNSELLFFTYSVLKCFLLFQNHSSTLLFLAQISPGRSSLLVDPHSFAVTMVQYFVFSAFSSAICVFCALAAFCSIGNSGLILKLITFAYQEAEATHCQRSTEAAVSANLQFFFVLFFFITATWHDRWTLCVYTRVGFGVPLHPGWPQAAARQCVMTAAERAACRYLLSAFFSTTLIFLHTLFWANRLLTKHNPESPACPCQHQSDIFTPADSPRGGKNTCIFMLDIPRW